MISVPGWLLMLLSILSTLLLLFIIIFLVVTIRSFFRRRKQNHAYLSGKYVPGRLMAYFRETNEEVKLSIIPKTYPTLLQGSNRSFNPAGKATRYNTSRTSSTSSLLHKQRSTSLSYSQDYINQAGNQVYREPTKSSTPARIVNMRRIRSLSTEMLADDSGSARSSRPGSGVEEAEWDECNQVYSHSDLLLDADISNVLDDQDPVINYDQNYHPVQQPSVPGPGTLFFTLNYNPEGSELLVTIKSGIDLVPVNGSGNSALNSYVNFCLVPEDFMWQRTNVIANENNPVFDQTFRIHDVLYHKLREYTLCFFVMDCTNPLGERVIGKVLYPLSDLRAEERVEVCKELSSP